MVFEMDAKYDMYIDDLTGLHNIKGFYREFRENDLTGFHFIYVDIDDFNKMNIIFGIDTVEDMLIKLSKQRTSSQLIMNLACIVLGKMVPINSYSVK